ncbi:MAG TPA: fatty acid--CoA ligase family protein [Polyangiaceae bacterium]
MSDEWFASRLTEWGDEPALAWSERVENYGSLLAKRDSFLRDFESLGIRPGAIVAVEGSFSPNACAAVLALAATRAVIVPLTPLMRAHRSTFFSIAEVQHALVLDDSDSPIWEHFERSSENPLSRKLIERGNPGLVIFSSGSTGTPKAVLHDLSRILQKFTKPRQKKVTLTFLLFDHIGGIDTMLGTFGSGGMLVTVPERTPIKVAEAIQRYRVHTLPASPTFLNMLIMSGVWQTHDLSSLRVIAYGTEPMPQSTLSQLHEVFPHAALVQTYGMSELGVLRSRSKDSGSLWMKFTGDGYQTKVVDGILWVKADNAMLGYLNAPDLFDKDGWLNTQDAVETDGEYVRILGRATDLINVGGQKVYPAEVESLLLQMENVAEVAVFGKPHPMMGQIVAARFNLRAPEPLNLFKRRMNAFCRLHLANYQIPVFVELVESDQYGARFKKLRNV